MPDSTNTPLSTSACTLTNLVKLRKKKYHQKKQHKVTFNEVLLGE